ncbi:MAG: toxin-antitoxin system TumE family protein [Candidatus Anammoxibacter sp.]
MKEILDEFAHIIKEVESSSTVEKYEFKFLKMKLRLVDGSSLRIWEKRVGDFLQRYSYYWLDELDNQIIGWDNAPHHPDIETFPDHKHVAGKSMVSRDRLIDVLKYIASRLQ